MILKSKSFSTLITILSGLHHSIYAFNTHNDSGNNTGLESELSSAPQTPIDFLTRRMPSTPLSLDNFGVDDLITHASSSEVVVDVSGDVSESSEVYTVGGKVGGSYNLEVENDHEEQEDNEEEEHLFVLPPSIQDMEEDCEEWAFDGECNANPRFMLKNCQRSCLKDLNTKDNDLLSWGLIGRHNPADNEQSCVDLYTIHTMQQDENEETCEDWAADGLCKSFDDKHFMLSQCARTCMVCIPPE